MTEEALVRQLKEGDKASFDLLYEKYKNMAFHTAYLITGNFSDSEDVVQDTFVKVWLHCRELKNEGGFKAWMMQILVRTVKSRLHTARKFLRGKLESDSGRQ